MRGTVAHGAAFSKHFAAFTLAPECDDAPGTSAGDDGNAGSSSLVVDVVLNAKDGWDRDLLGDVCNALHLPGSPYASNPSPDTPTRPPRNVVVELIDFTEERLEPVGDAGESPGVCYHPTRLRTRVPTSTDDDDDDDGWTTWTAAPRVDETPRASGTGKEKTKSEEGHPRRSLRGAPGARVRPRYPREGRGVVDVAGGSGDLAFQLSVRFGIPCTVVDPRGGGVQAHEPAHARRSRRARRTAPRSTTSGRVASPLARQLRREWSTFAPEKSAAHVKALFDERLMSDESTAALIRDCSALVGLHPDQATGAIVDCGLVMGKPWAVVPCCVFPSRYPNRLDASGRVARTTEALVEHIAGRASGTRRERLPCDGANEAVWWKPEGGAEGVQLGVGREDWQWPTKPPGVAGKTGGPFQLKALADSLNERQTE